MRIHIASCRLTGVTCCQKLEIWKLVFVLDLAIEDWGLSMVWWLNWQDSTTPSQTKTFVQCPICNVMVCCSIVTASPVIIDRNNVYSWPGGVTYRRDCRPCSRTFRFHCVSHVRSSSGDRMQSLTSICWCTFVPPGAMQSPHLSTTPWLARPAFSFDSLHCVLLVISEANVNRLEPNLAEGKHVT